LASTLAASAASTLATVTAPAPAAAVTISTSAAATLATTTAAATAASTSAAATSTATTAAATAYVHVGAAARRRPGRLAGRRQLPRRLELLEAVENVLLGDGPLLKLRLKAAERAGDLRADRGQVLARGVIGRSTA
jgi:hypothetical protein